jgi:phosphate:Na+ symporter
VFNVVTGLVAIVLIRQLVSAVDWISGTVGIAADDHTLKLAVFHTLFNLLGIAIMVPFVGRLVNLLRRVIHDRPPEAEGPRYIVSATVEFPDTALEAVRNETLYIYDNASDVIARGLCMKRDEILGDGDLARILEAQTGIVKMDMDDLYNRRVKRIFSDVIAFISKAEFSWKEWQSGELHWLRDANRNIVEAVKDVKHLQKNMVRYLASDNEHIRTEYNRIRLQIAELMRIIDRMRRSERMALNLLELDELKLSLREREKEQSRRLYTLIGEEKITPAMGTSLMNDSGYSGDIQRCLIAMAGTLFASRRRGITRAERQMALDETEIQELLDSGSGGGSE